MKHIFIIDSVADITATDILDGLMKSDKDYRGHIKSIQRVHNMANLEQALKQGGN